MAELAKKILIAGFREVKQLDKNGNEVVSIALIVKDKVAKNAMLKSKASMTGTIWAAKGFELAEVKREFPIGSELKGYTWGEQRESEFGGIYNVVESV